MDDCRDCKDWRENVSGDRYGFCINRMVMDGDDSEGGITLYQYYDECAFFERKEIEMTVTKKMDEDDGCNDCRECAHWAGSPSRDRPYGFCMDGSYIYSYRGKCTDFERRETEMKNRCGGCESWLWAAADTGLCGQAEVGRMVVTHLGGTPEIDRHFGCIFYTHRPTFRPDGPCIEHVPTGKKLSLPPTQPHHLEELCQWLNELYPAENS